MKPFDRRVAFGNTTTLIYFTTRISWEVVAMTSNNFKPKDNPEIDITYKLK